MVNASLVRCLAILLNPFKFQILKKFAHIMEMLPSKMKTDTVKHASVIPPTLLHRPVGNTFNVKV